MTVDILHHKVVVITMDIAHHRRPQLIHPNTAVILAMLHQQLTHKPLPISLVVRVRLIAATVIIMARNMLNIQTQVAAKLYSITMGQRENKILLFDYFKKMAKEISPFLLGLIAEISVSVDSIMTRTTVNRNNG